MANHKSTLKRIRQSNTRRLHNRYYAKTMRNALRDFRKASAEDAKEMLPKLQTMLDKLAKRNIIHKNKAANLKAGAMLHLAKLA